MAREKNIPSVKLLISYTQKLRTKKIGNKILAIKKQNVSKQVTFVKKKLMIKLSNSAKDENFPINGKLCHSPDLGHTLMVVISV